MAAELTIALDANGADAGPAEVARGAALAAASGEIGVIVFGPAAEIPAAPGVEVVDAPVSIAKDPDPARAVRRTPEVNAHWDEAAGEIVYYDRVQLGIGVSTYTEACGFAPMSTKSPAAEKKARIRNSTECTGFRAVTTAKPEARVTNAMT